MAGLHGRDLQLCTVSVLATDCTCLVAAPPPLKGEGEGDHAHCEDAQLLGQARHHWGSTSARAATHASCDENLQGKVYRSLGLCHICKAHPMFHDDGERLQGHKQSDMSTPLQSVDMAAAEHALPCTWAVLNTCDTHGPMLTVYMG